MTAGDAGRAACQAINAGGDTQHTSYATRAQTHAFMEQWEQSLDDARKAVTVKRDYAKVSPPSVREVVRSRPPSAANDKVTNVLRLTECAWDADDRAIC